MMTGLGHFAMVVTLQVVCYTSMIRLYTALQCYGGVQRSPAELPTRSPYVCGRHTHSSVNPSIHTNMRRASLVI